jgi:hypothetical protein
MWRFFVAKIQIGYIISKFVLLIFTFISTVCMQYLVIEKRKTHFTGRKVWRYTGKRLDKGYPKQMSKQDIPYKPNAAYIQKNQFADYQWYIFGVICVDFFSVIHMQQLQTVSNSFLHN